MSHAESETQGVWRGEGRSDQHPDHSNSETGTRSDGPNDGSVTGGTARADGKEADLAGGILARLIADADERLNEARECIEWYQREERRQLQRLQDLRDLQAIADSDDQAQ